MRRIVFNGKFYSGALNGVHRVADRLIREVDALLSAMPARARPAAELLLPVQRDWTPDLATIRLVEQAQGHRQSWEQLVLPRRAAGGVLVNLCNLAPIAHARKILLVHDAQFLFPDASYPARQRWGYRLLVPTMARTSATVLTVSQYSRAILDLTGVSPRARTHVLHNGADHMLETVPAPDVLARFGLTRGAYVLLFGSAKAYKNVGVVFDAFRDDRLRDLQLVVIGEGAERLAAAGYRAPPQVIFTGAIGDDVLRALYEGAACLAFPSRTEGFGLPPVEAMLLGCPALVAPAGAMPEICRDAACYADVDRPAEWAEAILALVHDPALRAAKIAAGRTAAARFSWAKAGRMLLDEALALAR